MIRIAAVILAVAGAIGALTLADPRAHGETEMIIDLTSTSPAEAFVGANQTDAHAVLGRPIREDQFQMSPTVSEFRIELRNFYGADESPDVREVTWSRSEDENLTLWFVEQQGGWIAIHHKSWHPETEF